MKLTPESRHARRLPDVAVEEAGSSFEDHVLYEVDDGRYYYGNEYVSVTDVGTASDNVLKGDNGELYFIDPIIKLKKPAPEVIDFLLSDDLSPKTLARGTQLPWWKALWKRLLH